MKLEEFERLAQKRFDSCLGLMVGAKHKEYSRNSDKLHNFKIAGQILNKNPEDALLGMMIKHFVLVIDIVNDLPTPPTDAILSEKITDSINYLVLLEALLKERMEGVTHDN